MSYVFVIFSHTLYCFFCCLFPLSPGFADHLYVKMPDTPYIEEPLNESVADKETPSKDKKQKVSF